MLQKFKSPQGKKREWYDHPAIGKHVEKTKLLWARRAPYLLAYSQLKAIQTLPLNVGVLSRHRAIHNDCGILKTTKAISAILRPLATEGIY